jgi:hypothetical protein
MRRTERWAAIALCGLVILGATPRAARAYEHRRDTPSVGVQINLGNLGVDSYWGDAFGWGRGVNIHLRNQISRNRAIGITFEQQRYDSEALLHGDDPTKGEDTDYLNLQTLLFDYFFYFNRPQRRCYYAVLSAGFYRPELVDTQQDPGQPKTMNVRYPGENFMARVGGGVEYFVSRKLSVDTSLSFYYIRTPGQPGLTGSGQLATGLHLYAGR